MRTHTGVKPYYCGNISLFFFHKHFFHRSVEKHFSVGQLDNAHANTHWRETFFLPEVWKAIYRCRQFGQSHANAHW